MSRVLPWLDEYVNISFQIACADYLDDFVSVRLERGGERSALVDASTRELALPNYGQDRVVFLAYVDGVVAGYGRAMRYEHRRDGNLYSTTTPLPEGWYLRGVVVKESFRKIGVARALSVERLKWLSSKTREVYCFLDSDEKLTIPMYRSLGFEVLSSDWSFALPELDGESGVLMRAQFSPNENQSF